LLDGDSAIRSAFAADVDDAAIFSRADVTDVGRLIGAAQPYIWRDITKANVVDYGMPCHLPVYQRLLQRQSITRTKLRIRYAHELATLDE
jgi:hypothetical protein